MELLDWLDSTCGSLTERLASLDVSRLSASEAIGLSAGFVALGKLADAGAVLVAQRAAEAHPDGAGGLARSAGISRAEAERAVATSKAVQALPATRQAMVEGRLSRPQAALTAEAAAVSPASEAGLLETATSQDLVGLRRHAERVKAACGDERLRRAKAHANRSTRTWVRDGEWHMHVTGTVDAGARIEFAHRPFWEAALDDAPKGAEREPFTAYGFDGLLAMAEAASGVVSEGAQPAESGEPACAGRKRLRRRRWQGVVRVDATSIRRGHTVDGEVCEIVGVGPIDVATAVDLLGDATVRVLVMDGRDVLTVATTSRYRPPDLDVAVAERGNWECANRCCSNAGFVEIDHDEMYSRSHDTSYPNLHPLCGRCHDLKTYKGHRIVESGGGTVVLVAPDDPDPP